MASSSTPASLLPTLLTERALRLMAGAASFERGRTVRDDPACQEAEGDRKRALGHRYRHQELPGKDLGRGGKPQLLLLVPDGR